MKCISVSDAVLLLMGAVSLAVFCFSFLALIRFAMYRAYKKKKGLSS